MKKVGIWYFLAVLELFLTLFLETLCLHGIAERYIFVEILGAAAGISSLVAGLLAEKFNRKIIEEVIPVIIFKQVQKRLFPDWEKGGANDTQRSINYSQIPR